MFAAVAVVPTILHAGARVEPATSSVKSGVLVVEQAAGSLLDGRNPYAVVHNDGALATWPTWAQEHFPYLAAVLAVGVPRAIAGSSPWTDPRLVYLVLALVIAVSSILRSGLPAESRLRAFQVLFVLVTGAPLVFSSGKEILVIGLLVASLVAFDRDRAFVSGLATGAAAGMHQPGPWLIWPSASLVSAVVMAPVRTLFVQPSGALIVRIGIVAASPFIRNRGLAERDTFSEVGTVVRLPSM